MERGGYLAHIVAHGLHRTNPILLVDKHLQCIKGVQTDGRLQIHTEEGEKKCGERRVMKKEVKPSHIR